MDEQAERAGWRTPGAVLVVAAAVSVQVGAAVAKSLFDHVGPPAVVLLRLAFGAAAVLLLTRPAVRGRPARDLGLVAALGLALVCLNTSFYASLERLPLGIAVTVEFVGPLVVAVLASRRRLDLVWIAFAAGGIALLADPQGDLDAVGIAFGLVAAFFWAVYIVLGVRVGRVWPGSGGLGIAMAVGAALAIPGGVVTGGTDMLSPVVLVGGAAVGLMCSAVPWSLELEAMRRLPTHVFGVLLSVEPAIAALVGLVVLGERLEARVVAAIALVTVGSAGAALGAGDPEVPVDA